jgi:hypothetical protein
MRGTGITTSTIPLLREDGRSRFDQPRRLSVRLLEAALAILWILSAGVVVAAPILWF